jgi:hypothetical protein
MKLFLFERLDRVTDRWHPEGGVVIVANSREDALQLVLEKNAQKRLTYDEQIEYGSDGNLHWPDRANIVITASNWEYVREYELADGDYAREVIVFADAGCC